MGQLSKVLRNAQGLALLFWCPGCGQAHCIHHGAGSGPRWLWNGDAERPVFTPSVLVTFDHWVPPATPENPYPGPQTKRRDVCHSYVGCNGAAPGQIVFLPDSTHALAGQTVDLPEWPQREAA